MLAPLKSALLGISSWDPVLCKANILLLKLGGWQLSTYILSTTMRTQGGHN